MNILDFPAVQILGLNATVRDGDKYTHLGMYNLDGSFEWSPEGLLRRDALLQEEVKEPEPAPVAEVLIVDPEAKLQAELAEARARNEVRRKKARSK